MYPKSSNTKHFQFFFVFVLALFVMFSLKQDSQTRRKKYEAFLNSELGKIKSWGPSNSYWLQKPDRPDLAAFQNYLMTLDPQTRTVPKKRLQKAFPRLKSLEQEKSLLVEDVNLVWKELPSNMGGRTRALVFDPNDPENKKVWAGAVTGGLWYNDDITSPTGNWVPVDDFMDNLSISCIVFDLNNSQIMYVGTGESQTAVIIYRESSGLGKGILKSMDGGDTWDWLDVDFSFIIDNKSNSPLELKVYPNPTRGKLTVDIGTSLPYSQLSVIALSGEILLEKEIHQTNRSKLIDLDLSGFPPGTYLIRVVSGNNTFTGKAIIY